MSRTFRSVWPWIWTGLVGITALAAVLFVDADVGDWWERLVIVVLPTFLTALGAIIARRQPGNLIAWLLIVAGSGLLASAVLGSLYGVEHGPPVQSNFWDFLLIWVAGAAGLVLFYSLVLLVYVFPTGRLLSKRWSWVVWIPVAFTSAILFMAAFTETVGPFFADEGETRWAIENPIGFIPLSFLDTTLTVWSVLIVIILPVGAVASLFFRYRRAESVERAQIRWVLFGALVAGISYPLSVWIFTDNPTLSGVFGVLAFSVLPVVITVAITRYRLFEIDRLISRTVSYAIVVGFLGVVFAAGVVWIPTVFGLSDSPILVATSTLAVAALFNPLRKRVQTLVDRRFNRSGYNATRLSEALSESLQQTMSEAELTENLLTAVNAHFEPSASTVWLRGE